jgi:hypothetical protein
MIPKLANFAIPYVVGGAALLGFASWAIYKKINSNYQIEGIEIKIDSLTKKIHIDKEAMRKIFKKTQKAMQYLNSEELRKFIRKADTQIWTDRDKMIIRTLRKICIYIELKRGGFILQSQSEKEYTQAFKLIKNEAA